MHQQQFEQYYGEYQQKLQSATSELNKITTSLSIKQRDRKMSELTYNQLMEHKDSPAYRSVGKMFVLEKMNTITGEIKEQVQVLAKDVQALEKLKDKYDQERKDAERNLESLLAKVKQEGLVQ
jgi:chaperonin cofactor prefoldin